MATTHSKEKRRVQLRTAKREQRLRQRRDGFIACQVVVPQAVGKQLLEAAKRADVLTRMRAWLVPEIVEIVAWPQLQMLCWGRHDQWLSGADALAIYERNWRFIAQEALTAEERQLIHDLAARHGNGVLNV